MRPLTGQAGDWADEIAAYNVANENGRRGYDMLPLLVGGRIPYLRPRHSMAYVRWVYDQTFAAARHTKFKRACASNPDRYGRMEGGPGSAANTHPTLTHHSASDEANREAS